MNNLKSELIEEQVKHGIVKKIACTDQEEIEFSKLLDNGNPLPEGVYENKGTELFGFYRVNSHNLSNSEIQELMLYRQTSSIKTIKNILLGFSTVAILSVLALIYLMF